jgi:FAD:protein FMN transferase
MGTMTHGFSQRRRLLVLGAVGGAALVAGGKRLISVDDGVVSAFGGATMGTRFTVKLAGVEPTDAELSALRADVQAAFDRVDEGMSIFRPNSEVSQFNRAAAGAAFSVSEELFAVLSAAQRVSQWSGGAFDVTVAPLVESWGFGTDKTPRVPTPQTLHTDRSAVGWRGVRLDHVARTASKDRSTLRVDLGGIAKGYGVDLAAAALDHAGVLNYMIELGGEVRTRGVNATGVAWRIGIEQPDALPQRARHVVPISGRAMATSGDYRIFFMHDGRRYSHEIDPASGAPITHGLASVTVVADDCMAADALATALIVLGPERGFALAERSGMAAQFVLRSVDESIFEDRMTNTFAQLRPESA